MMPFWLHTLGVCWGVGCHSQAGLGILSARFVDAGRLSARNGFAQQVSEKFTKRLLIDHLTHYSADGVKACLDNLLWRAPQCSICYYSKVPHASRSAAGKSGLSGSMEDALQERDSRITPPNGGLPEHRSTDSVSQQSTGLGSPDWALQVVLAGVYCEQVAL